MLKIYEQTQYPEAPDYSKESSWYKFPKSNDKKVDTIFLAPTLNAGPPYGSEFAGLDEFMAQADDILGPIASIFEETNFYLPAYRQVYFSKAAKLSKEGESYLTFVHLNITYKDVEKALDYYFENCNNGRPFILAGHSQGSCIGYIVLEEYMKKKHPEYLDRMVAAYLIGWGQPKYYYENNPELKFAEGETDTGVIISWNTVGTGAWQKTIVIPHTGTYAINPLNWKRDDTYAGPEMNKGSFVNGEIVMNYADAKLNLDRGCVESNTEFGYLVMNDVLGDKSLHNGDYRLFYNNIKENCAKRIEAFLNKEN